MFGSKNLLVDFAKSKAHGDLLAACKHCHLRKGCNEFLVGAFDRCGIIVGKAATTIPMVQILVGRSFDYRNILNRYCIVFRPVE